jgi:hypothetical protein
MAQTTAQKLRIKEGMTLLTLHAPADFASSLPPGIKASAKAKDYAQIHWFVQNKAQMEKEVSDVLALLNGDVLCWIYYPKGTSGIQTDLTRDKGWESLLRHKDLQWVNLVSFDDTWSAFAMRRGEPKVSKPSRQNPVLEYADSATKTVRLPEDLAKAFKPHKAASAFFDTLAFSHKKEYVEWIVTAKREETRADRIRKTIEKLEQQWKNPRNL